MFNTNELKSAIAVAGLTENDCKKALKMSDRTWNYRMSGNRDWKLGEIDEINSLLVKNGWRGNPERIWFYGTV